MAEQDDFDHVLVNDDVERAVAELEALVDRLGGGEDAPDGVGTLARWKA